MPKLKDYEAMLAQKVASVDHYR